MKPLLAIAALLFTTDALAQTTFLWNNTSSGPVPEGTKLYCTLTKPYGATPSATVPFSQQTATFALAADVTPRSYFCVARHYKSSVESPDSNEITVAVPAVPLPAPQQFRVTGSLTMNPDGSWQVSLKAVPK